MARFEIAQFEQLRGDWYVVAERPSGQKERIRRFKAKDFTSRALWASSFSASFA